MLEKNKPPGGLNSGFTVGGIFVVLGGPVVLKSDLRSLVLLGERCVTPKKRLRGRLQPGSIKVNQMQKNRVARAVADSDEREGGGGGHPDPEIKRGWS